MSIIKLVGGSLAGGLAACLGLIVLDAFLVMNAAHRQGLRQYEYTTKGWDTRNLSPITPGRINIDMLTAFILGTILSGGGIFLWDTKRTSDAARQQSEDERLRKLREEDQERRRFQSLLEDARQQAMDAVKDVPNNWSTAASRVEDANRHYEKAKAAFEAERPAIFYEGLQTCQDSIASWKHLTKLAKDKFVTYQDRLREMVEYANKAQVSSDSALLKLPALPPLEGEEKYAQALSVIEVAAANLFMTAEKRTDWVMIRLQMEGNRLARQHYEASLSHFERASEYFTQTGRFQERVIEQLEDLQDLGGLAVEALAHLGNRMESIDDGIRASVEQARLSHEAFQRHSEHAARTTKTVHAILHDIHGRSVPDRMTNRYQRHAH